MGFPYGKAPLCILLLALISGLGVYATQRHRQSQEPDLVFALFARIHHEAYIDVVKEFEESRGVKVQMQLVHGRALQSRLQSAFLVGADVPDVVEVPSPAMGYFTKGPLDDVGFVDITERLHSEGLYDRLVESRFSLWSSRGRIFAIPHDVHPVTLAYRRDLVEELGIDVESLKTWDDFVAMGRGITKDLDGDGVIDRYAIDLPSVGAYGVMSLLLQNDCMYFDPDGNVAFDSARAAETICWYIEQLEGKNRIATTAGEGQTLAKSMQDGLALFYICPDWRSRFYELDIPQLKGKMKLMPLPAWREGGRRTSTWGGTGLAIAKQCENFELAWDFCKFLYLDKAELGKRFKSMNIIPPLKDAWDLPEFSHPSEYYSGQAIGELLVELAPEAPPDYVTAYTNLARGKVDEALANGVIYYKENGNKGLREYVESELKRLADYVRKIIARNRFLRDDRGDVSSTEEQES